MEQCTSVFHMELLYGDIVLTKYTK